VIALVMKPIKHADFENMPIPEIIQEWEWTQNKFENTKSVGNDESDYWLTRLQEINNALIKKEIRRIP
jgi:hypothetical protein